jgi:nitrogen fixation protein
MRKQLFIIILSAIIYSNHAICQKDNNFLINKLDSLQSYSDSLENFIWDQEIRVMDLETALFLELGDWGVTDSLIDFNKSIDPHGWYEHIVVREMNEDKELIEEIRNAYTSSLNEDFASKGITEIIITFADGSWWGGLIRLRNGDEIEFNFYEGIGFVFD